MATTQHLLLSPAELAYLHTSLSLAPPIRPDGRTATQFRPLTAETGILPGTNGSARVCFSDGTEAIVGVKAEVERTRVSPLEDNESTTLQEGPEVTGDPSWVEVTVEIPGYRDDDSNTVFLGTMLSEALLAGGDFAQRLWINRRFHWKLYLDIILISPPLSYPLPLLSLTSHLALLATRLPRLKSEGDEDPMFDDDWAASTFLFPTAASGSDNRARPPITLLVMAVGDNTIFDPSKEELAVADSALAVSVGVSRSTQGGDDDVAMESSGEGKQQHSLRLLSVRTIDPPSRLTAPGVPNAVNAAAWGHGNSGGGAKDTKEVAATTTTPAVGEGQEVEGVWQPPRGGAKLAMLGSMVQKVLENGGVANEVLEALDGVELA